VPHNTMSAHLAVLSADGLASSEREGRVIRYRARYDTLRDLITFLMRDCCQGAPEIVGDLPALVSSCMKGDCT
jgi:ArsR family transcriptional regulator, arsenate/arsenite/antimonite-responsive transcriptional repressor